MSFFAFGVNHKNTTLEVRSLFAMNDEQKNALYVLAESKGVDSLVILNTCNRTEVYGISNYEWVKDRFLDILQVPEEFHNHIFEKHDKDAIEHVFNVTSGLDSQIVGDLEILGQVKNAFTESKKRHALNSHFERLANTALQSAKSVRHNTALSTGTTSLAYAAIQYIKQLDLPNASVLILGCGKFGTTVARNVHSYLPLYDLTLCNRSIDKSQRVASETDGKVLPFEDVPQCAEQYDIVISCLSNLKSSILKKSDFKTNKKQYFLDLSVPTSIDTKINELTQKQVVSLDYLSKSLSETKEKRESEIPIAKSIVSLHMMEFMDWYKVNEHSNSIRYYKNMLSFYAENCPHMKKLPDELLIKHINISMSKFVSYIRKNHQVPENLEKEDILMAFLDANHQRKTESLESLSQSLAN